MSTIKIIVDSTSDIDTQWVAKYGIRVVPVFVNFGTESFADDGIDITRPQFYERLTKSSGLPTTAAPPPGLIEEAFRDGLKEADHIVAFSVSSKLSGVYNGMLLAARNVAEDRITVIDSHTLSMSLGWQALAAAEAVARGARLDEVVRIAESVRERAYLYAGLDTMEFLRRSGRVSWASANLGALLQIKPLIKVEDSLVKASGRVRTFKKVMQEMVDIAHKYAPIERLAVLHSNAPDRAEELRQMLLDVAPPGYTVLTDVTTAVGTHVGPGAVGLAFVQAAS